MDEKPDIQWPQLDFESDTIALEPDETKNREGRSVPILKGDIRDPLLAAKKKRDELWPDSPWVFNREGKKIIDFRTSWENACKAAGAWTEVSRFAQDGCPKHAPSGRTASDTHVDQRA